MIRPAPQIYRQLIVDESQDLPLNLLIKIADFVTFLRKRATNLEILTDEQVALQMSDYEAHYLDMEFQNYEQRFPHQEGLYGTF